MEEEYFISGFCRCQNQTRTVTLSFEDGEEGETDCLYGDCPHEGSCEIAAQIKHLECAWQQSGAFKVYQGEAKSEDKDDEPGGCRGSF